MNKSHIIGIVLIGVIMFGFTWYQSKQYEKQREYQAQLDYIRSLLNTSKNKNYIVKIAKDELNLYFADEEIIYNDIN